MYRAIDQFGQVIDIFVASRRDATAARRFFQQAINTTQVTPTEVVTDKAATYPIVLDEFLPAVWHHTDQYANNHIEADHGRLKARLRPMRGLKQDGSVTVIIKGHAFMQNVRRALRAGRRGARRRAGGGRIRRADRGHLTRDGGRGFSLPASAQTQQRRRHMERSSGRNGGRDFAPLSLRPTPGRAGRGTTGGDAKGRPKLPTGRPRTSGPMIGTRRGQ
jgi:hypothetical protein